MKKLFFLFLYFVILLGACTKATAPTTVPLSSSTNSVSATNTPGFQSTKAIAPPTSTQTTGAQALTLDIGSTMVSDKDGATLVYVPEGDFLMGSNERCDSCKDVSPSFSDNIPQHTVTINAFWIDQTEVTNKQYARCVSAGRCTLPSSLKSPMRSSYYGNSQFDNYPVVYVEWSMAKEYCEWAGRRLSTEAEWEKAARGNDGRIYPWGNIPPTDGLLNYDSPIRDTTAVGSYPDGKSMYGAYDMAGNVWEWVNDWYDENYYRNSSTLNPLGPDFGESKIDSPRGLRGGSWYYEDGSLRSIFRFGVVPVDFLVRSDTRSWAIPDYEETSIYGKPPLGFGTVGFRCALSTSP